jgi:sec-independent protein translocase protein TatC
VIEPFWSFDQYFEFVLVLFYSTGLAFQIPILQILLGLLNIISAKQMLAAWRYVILISTIIGAVLTPSTDPLTQLLLSGAILLLYFSGVGILFLIKN